MKRPIEFSLILPCLNEAETLGKCIEQAKSFFKRNNYSHEIIVVDNGSTDNSVDIAKRFKVKTVKAFPKGYGHALQAGFNAAQGKFLIMGDADNSYDFSALKPFTNKLRQGYEFVIGNRFKGEIKDGAMSKLNRYIGNPVLSYLGHLFFVSQVNDFHCGLRALTRESWSLMNLQTTGMEYASEMVIKATFLKLKMIEVPITYYPDGRTRPSNLNRWRDGWRHLRLMLLFVPNWLYFYPGSFLIIIGLLLFSVVIFGQLHIMGIVLDVHTLLIATVLMILGIQIVCFGIFTKVYLIQSNLLKREASSMNRFARILNLETGIISSLIIILIGCFLMLTLIFIWYRNNFGPLNYTYTLRIMIPAVFLIQLGMQILFNSFFLSFILLPKKSNI